LRDNGPVIRGFDVAYFMISVDTPEDNKAFAEKESADFPLLSDPSKAVATRYGVLGPFGLPRRWTFYIGTDGRILDIDKAVNSGRAGADLANKLKALGITSR
jgi:thioredoxin-dependent peroxiredoxin